MPVDEPSSRGLRNILRRPYAMATIIFVGVMAVPLLGRSGDFEKVILEAARRLLQGRDFYAIAETLFTYPPAIAFFSLPLVSAPVWVIRATWFLINALCVALFLSGSWRLSGGARLEVPKGESWASAFRRDWRTNLVLWLGLLVAGRFITDVLEHHQTDVIVAALVTLGAVLLLKGDWLRSAMAIGLAAGLKATPLIFVPYYVLQRRFGAACALLAVAVGINFLPDLVSHPVGGGTWAGRWAEVVVGPLFGKSQTGGWYTTPVLNQSLSGTIHRLAEYQWPAPDKFFDPTMRTAPPAPAVVKALILGSQLGVLMLGFGSMAAAMLVGRRGQASTCLEASILLMLMVLVSPASSKPHFLVMLLPAWCLARRAVFGRDPFSTGCLFLAAIASIASLRVVPGGNSAQWAGSITVSAVFLMIGCCAALYSPALATVGEADGAGDE